MGGFNGGMMPGFGGFNGGMMPGFGGVMPGFGFGGLGVGGIGLGGFNLAPLNRVFGGPFEGPATTFNGGTWAGPMREFGPFGVFGLSG